MSTTNAWRTGVISLCVGLLLAGNSGCVGLIANLIYAGTGNKVPARFDGLKERKVAVVVMDSQGAIGPSLISQQLAQRISISLKNNVKEINVLDPQTVEDWIDEHNWDYLDFQALGKGVGCESLVAVDIDSFSLHDGQTMYKGQANIHLSVYDILDQGKEVYSVTPRQIEYPVNGGYHTTDIPERDFRKLFLDKLAQRIARHFFAYEAIEEYAEDTTLVGPR